MVKKSKRKTSRRMKVGRRRTSPCVSLLDLSDDLILAVFRKLGMTGELTATKLRIVAPAFQLAASCTRLYQLFMRQIGVLQAADDFLPFQPAMRHPTQSPTHIAWLLRHAPNLREIQLPDTCAHLLADIPSNVPIEDIRICNVSNSECTVPTRLPRTLKKLCIYFPSSSSVSFLASLHGRRQHFQLQRLSLCGVEIQHAPQLRKFFSHSARQMQDVLLAFKLSLEPDQRARDTKIAVEFIRETCYNSHTEMPHLDSLAFSVHQASRLDGDWGHSHLPAFIHPVNNARAQNQSRLGNSSLRMLFAYTDADLMEDWVEALGGAIAPTTFVMLEAGLNMITIVPPFLRSVPEMESGLMVLRTRLTTLLNKQFPYIDTIRSSVMQGRLETLSVTERFVVEHWFYFSDEHREMMRTYIGLPSTVHDVRLTFAFGAFAERAAFYAEEGNMELLPILTMPHEEEPNYVAFSFLNEIISNVRNLDSLEVSFEVVNYAVKDPSMVELLLRALPELTEFHLIMPIVGWHQNPIEAGIVDVTDQFILGLPIFVYLLGEACPKLERLAMQNLATQVVCDGELDLLRMLDEAVAALNWLERKRPQVATETIRAMLDSWSSSLV